MTDKELLERLQLVSDALRPAIAAARERGNKSAQERITQHLVNAWLELRCATDMLVVAVEAQEQMGK